MSMPRRLIVVVFLLAVAPQVARAWNGTGHRVISSIAYRDDGPRTRGAE